MMHYTHLTKIKAHHIHPQSYMQTLNLRGKTKQKQKTKTKNDQEENKGKYFMKIPHTHTHTHTHRDIHTHARTHIHKTLSFQCCLHQTVRAPGRRPELEGRKLFLQRPLKRDGYVMATQELDA